MVRESSKIHRSEFCTFFLIFSRVSTSILPLAYTVLWVALLCIELKTFSFADQEFIEVGGGFERGLMSVVDDIVR